jgi:hypothetical protein
MSIFNRGDFFAKAFTVSQPQLNSSDRTAQLKAKTKYAAAVNLAKNGGVLTKGDGSKYVGTVRTSSTALISTASYSDLLDVTKGKYLLTPPPSSNLDGAFSPTNGEVYYGSFSITKYHEAGVLVTMLGTPAVTESPTNVYNYNTPNQLVVSGTSPPPFNNTSIVVDPEYRLFYGNETCGNRGYFKNVYIDPSADVTWSTTEEAVGFGSNVKYASSRPYNQQQAQRILANQAQTLRGFQYPTRVHFDLDNCRSKPSITPVAPDAPIICITHETPLGVDSYIITISWLHNFDGGSPITTEAPTPPGTATVWGYTIYTKLNGAITSTSITPQPCLNTHTATVLCGTEIWITASNCVPISNWEEKTGTLFQTQKCTTLTSPESNHVFAPSCTPP